MWLQSVRHRTFRDMLDQWKISRTSLMSANQAFHLATRGGAQALRRDDLGIIQVGAKTDIVAFDGSSTNMIGWRDPIAAIILYSNVGNVKHVMVDGRFLKNDGTLISGSLANITDAFLHSTNRIQEQATQNPWHLEGGYIMNTAAQPGYPETVDAVRGAGTGY